MNHTATPSARSLFTMTDTRKSWLIAVTYVISIYATLEIVPAPLAYLRAHNILRLSITALFLSCLAYIFTVMHSRTRNVWRHVGLALLAVLYAWAVALVKRPEEKIHFIQYGLVGALFVRAARHHIKRPLLAYAVALLIASAAGWFDETLQGWLPNRHYDVSDIALDVGSAFLGLVVYSLIPHRDGSGQKASG